VIYKVFRVSVNKSKVNKTSLRSVRIGFVALIDAAPIIMAHELGYFRKEGLDVSLCRQIGWGNVRDKLAFGQLNASHALLGLPLQCHIGQNWPGEPVVALMSLGSGGDAITLSDRLVRAGVNSAVSLRKFIKQSNGHLKPIFAHVSSCSMHHYLLRDWLAAGEINPDEDVRLCVLPPAQMAGQIASGHLDGFCVGEPWNTMAHRSGAGHIVSLTTDILPSHPEKVLAVNQRWAQRESDLLAPLVRAVLRGCAYCAKTSNHSTLAKTLSDAKYLNVSDEIILASLVLDRTFGMRPSLGNIRPHDWTMRSFDATFPSVSHFAWMTSQMIRWQHVDASVSPWDVAARCIDAAPYREAATDLQIICPANDAPPMRLRHGRTFEPNHSASVLLV
jgi:ABC-type nitrate/sulfonate/bicarbonate transport system substrate-binding protein